MERDYTGLYQSSTTGLFVKLEPSHERGIGWWNEAYDVNPDGTERPSTGWYFQHSDSLAPIMDDGMYVRVDTPKEEPVVDKQAKHEVVGLAALGSTTEEIRHFDYQVMSTGLYAIVFGPVTVFLDISNDWVDISTAITDHEDAGGYVPVSGEGAISCKVERFRKVKEALEE